MLVYNKNKIDWQDFYEQIVSQMLELRLETESEANNFVTAKILEGVDVRDASLEEYIPDIIRKVCMNRLVEKILKGLFWLKTV